jgi:bacterioferritin-associated ferredoxin
MIVCSCNVFSDHQLRSTLANATQRLRMSQIYDYLGCGAQCGRCAHIIKRIMDEMTNGADTLSQSDRSRRLVAFHEHA